ncbi:uncharacterized protein LOC111632560 [Centruroides sculpturatus]|uniref:uncharacterized protein LOC111632560 n=1 Tax=Centruroides sculpturatus TaxID=218467 RepID=UPI000C6DAB16|nr:uncharacterized protein LOC111632560 [Centruroides sculpturatus]
MKVSKKEDMDEFQIILGNRELERVKKFEYLRSWITSDNRCKMEIKSRINKAKAACYQIYHILTNRGLNIKLKIKILRTMIWSVLTYGCEAWTLTHEMMERINSFEMWCLRKMQRISWTEKITNEEVLDRLGLRRRLLINIQQRKVRYAGHLARGSGGQLLKTVIDRLVEGTRPRGRPRKTWRDKSFPVQSLMLREAWNRETWRRIVHQMQPSVERMPLDR